MEDNTHAIAELEALLFIHGEPLAKKKIKDVLKINDEKMEVLFSLFDERLKDSGRGLCLLRDGEKVQLTTKAEFAGMLTRFVKEELTEELTPAALEALSVVAYLGPIPRSTLDYIRGVNSSFIVRNLLVRGLIERSVAPERPTTYLYKASFDLWKHLGISYQDELPEYEKFRTLVNDFLNPLSSEPSDTPTISPHEETVTT